MNNIKAAHEGNWESMSGKHGVSNTDTDYINTVVSDLAGQGDNERKQSVPQSSGTVCGVRLPSEAERQTSYQLLLPHPKIGNPRVTWLHAITPDPCLHIVKIPNEYK